MKMIQKSIVSENLVHTSLIVIWAILILIAARQNASGAPLLWSKADGGNGNYYDCVDFTGGTWAAAMADVPKQAFTLNGDTYTGHLAAITTPEELTFLQQNFVGPYIGDWAIVWTGNYANNGVLYGSSGTPITDTSWINWVNPYGENNTPEFTLGQSGNYPVTISGSGYDYSWNVMDPAADGIGQYVVEYAVGSSIIDVVPEPGSYVLLGLGAASLTLLRRKAAQQ